MRKIKTKEEYEKKDKRNKIIVGVVLIILMLGSTAGYAFFSIIGGKQDEGGTDFGGTKFVLGEDNLWYFNIQGQEFSSIYNPEQVKDIKVDINLSLETYYQKPLYFSYDSVNEGISEILRNIQRYVERVQFACIDECEENLPVKDCSENIIIIKEGNETLINQDGNCIYILGKQQNVIKASDAFIFKLLEI